MPPVTELTRVLRAGERVAPKTILAFFGAMTTIAAGAVIAVIAVLEGTPDLRYLIPIILIVFAVVFVGILVAVVALAWKDPSKLMLGQITGREFAVIQQITQGDSNAGEHVDKIIMGVEGVVTTEIEPSPDPTKVAELLNSTTKDDAR